MKRLCRKTLYWYQTPGFDGMLSENPAMDSIPGEPVFETGKKYETFSVVATSVTGQWESISLFAVAEDGRRVFRLLKENLTWDTARLVRRHFESPDLSQFELMN